MASICILRLARHILLEQEPYNSHVSSEDNHTALRGKDLRPKEQAHAYTQHIQVQFHQVCSYALIYWQLHANENRHTYHPCPAKGVSK